VLSYCPYYAQRSSQPRSAPSPTGLAATAAPEHRDDRGKSVARRKTSTVARARRTRSRSAPRLPQRSAIGPPVTNRQAGVPAVSSAATEPVALVVTRWFDPEEAGDPDPATVRFAGRRTGVSGSPGAGDSFTQEERIEGIVPGCGPVAISAWVYGLKPGDWTVTANLVAPRRTAASSLDPHERRRTEADPLPVASWSWLRWSLSAGAAAPVQTRWALLAPLARTPAVIPGVYTALAVIAIVVALATQAAVLAAEVPVGPSLLASLLGLAAGLIGAKVWYWRLHPDESPIRGGWAVDGFLIVAPVAAVVAMLVLDVPIGLALAAVAPGLLFAVAIGRVGCFVTGCCAGRITGSRWGVWSSDRRVGARRIPTQLLESAAGLLIGLGALGLVVGLAPALHGVVFLAGFAAYGTVRQALLRLRVERRRSSRTLPATAAAVVLVVLVIAAALLVQGG
jgi:phosphatidylglycerol:prolipoprotein diacylglycerol transferase